MSDFLPVVIPPDDSPSSPRRTFLARLAGGFVAWPALRHRLLPRPACSATQDAAAHQPGVNAARQPNATTLAALGDAVLPAAALGEGGVTRAVAEFQRWMDDYEPGAEANHGYGTGRIARLPADPRPRWRAQLAELDAEATRGGAASFAALSRERRQALVRAALAEERGESLPAPLTARHVAVALLAHFYDSPAATDLCYEAQIGRQQCRPLAAQRQAPVPLSRRGR